LLELNLFHAYEQAVVMGVEREFMLGSQPMRFDLQIFLFVVYRI